MPATEQPALAQEETPKAEPEPVKKHIQAKMDGQPSN